MPAEARQQIAVRQLDRAAPTCHALRASSRADATSRTRAPRAFAAIASRGRSTARCPRRSTACGVMRARMQTLASAARFRGGVPPVHVERRDRPPRSPAACMRCQRGVEALAVLERAQDVIGGAVDDAAEAGDLDRRQRLAHQVEDRDAVHHGAFEEERRVAIGGERAQLLEGEARAGPLFAVTAWQPACSAART